MTPFVKDPLHDLSQEITTTLRMVFWQNWYATNAIQDTITHHQDWAEDTRGEFSEIVYDIIRWWRTLWYIIDHNPSAYEKDLQQLLTMYLFLKKGGFATLNKKRGTDTQRIIQRINTIKTIRALRESLPNWMDNQGQKELGMKWDSIIASLNTIPAQIIRVNTLKTTHDQLANNLQKEGIIVEKIDGIPDALILRKKINLFRLASFQAGLFEVQDAASQMASRFLDPKPGMRVVDACAGEGSKTLHLATLMNNKGTIIALDTQNWRLKELRKRATKAGIDTIETRCITSSKVYKRMSRTADRLLLDVPCSGTGTLRRNPDIKWKLTLTDFERLKTLQQDLLNRYCTLLKPTGTMVYSVCSIFPSEGERQVQRFIKDHPTFNIIKEKRYWPNNDNTDGFYFGLIQYTGEHQIQNHIIGKKK